MEDTNPYRSPATASVAVAVPAPGARLYRVSGIVLGTFMGTPLATGWLMSRNYRALGDHARARQALTYGAIACALVLALVYVLPENVPAMVFTIPQLFAASHIAKRFQGDRIAEYEASDRTYSNWRAVGVGLLCCLAVLVVLVPIVIGLALAGVIE
ncbi:hypothetical protein GOY17_01550 [Lysobacter soli]|uniref:hypothetical protein n=1 Tax=Lysobacter soli TaxID=453783 RepID=UPI0012EE5418|nr:hypothetical protein [Lysobacter soli]QGW63719.1 hypothetical protein GOY17_01550 [Lysobacter soli]